MSEIESLKISVVFFDAGAEIKGTILDTMDGTEMLPQQIDRCRY